MASFQLYTDPLVTCPYNPAHRLKKSRMQIHLTKCKKNHVEAELKECPYNAQHRIPQSEYQYHLAHCEDRRVVERQVVYESNDDHHGNTSVPPYRNNQAIADDEVWDLAPQPRSGYDPTKRLENGSGLILTIKGQPAERRNQYQKMFSTASTDNCDINRSVTSSENVNSLNRPVATPVEIKPLRKPKINFEDMPPIPPIGYGRGQVQPQRRKIAANIYGGGMENGSGGQVGFGRGTNPVLGAGRGLISLMGAGRGAASDIQQQSSFPAGHPALAPGQVRFLQD